MLIKISLCGEDDWEARLIENLEKKEQSFFSNMSWYFSDFNESEVGFFFFFFFFFFIFDLGSFFVILTHIFYCNRWQWHLLLYFSLKIFALFIQFIYLLYLFHILSFSLVWLLFTYYYEYVNLFGKKEIFLIDAF